MNLSARDIIIFLVSLFFYFYFYCNNNISVQSYNNNETTHNRSDIRRWQINIVSILDLMRMLYNVYNIGSALIERENY